MTKYLVVGVDNIQSFAEVYEADDMDHAEQLTWYKEKRARKHKLAP